MATRKMIMTRHELTMASVASLCRLADELGATLVIRRYPNQNARFTCSFDYAETKDGKEDALLASTYGEGNSPEEAMADYASKISNKIVVFNAYTSHRRQVAVTSELVAS